MRYTDTRQRGKDAVKSRVTTYLEEIVLLRVVLIQKGGVHQERITNEEMCKVFREGRVHS